MKICYAAERSDAESKILQAMRQSIDNYTLDKQAAPQSLDDLVQAGYLRMVPKDPMTGAADWAQQYDSVVLSPDQSSTGLVDVHSNSSKVSPFESTPYQRVVDDPSESRKIIEPI